MIYGIKNYSKTGIISIDNKHFNIEYNSLRGHLETEIIYLSQFIFSWNCPLDYQKINITSNINRIGKT